MGNRDSNMNNLFDLLWQSKSKSSERLMELETLLSAVIKPVTPRPEFIHDLRDSLINHSYPESKPNKKGVLQSFLLVLVGAASTVVVFSVGMRIMAAVVGVLGLLRFSGRQFSRRRLIQPG